MNRLDNRALPRRLGWSRFLLHLLLLIPVLPARAFAEPSSKPAEPVVAARLLIVRGSAWDTPRGREEIEVQAREALRIWRDGVGLPLSIAPVGPAVEGDLRVRDLGALALRYNSSERDIVCLFTDEVVPFYHQRAVAF